MVSAAKLNRAQENAQSYMPYTEKLRNVVESIARATGGGIRHPMLETREVHKTGYLVITADRGLAGGYNNNVLRKVYQTIEKRHRSEDEYALIVFGKIGANYFRRRKMKMEKVLTGLPDQPDYEDVKEIAKETVALFSGGKIDELYMYYNHFISVVSQQVREQKLLPLAGLEEEKEGRKEEKGLFYEYEPSPEEVLESLLPRYAEGLIYGALLDAKAAEHAARMTAMRNATDNATEMIDDLTLSYNRARQAAITQEISEIVAGANALD